MKRTSRRPNRLGFFDTAVEIPADKTCIVTRYTMPWLLQWQPMEQRFILWNYKTNLKVQKVTPHSVRFWFIFINHRAYMIVTAEVWW